MAACVQNNNTVVNWEINVIIFKTYSALKQNNFSNVKIYKKFYVSSSLSTLAMEPDEG